MTVNGRVFVNILATYGRTILNVACGLFSARWVLEALGQTDFGLFGVVGGLVVFIEFINGQFSGAVSRFYGIALGERQASNDKSVALENCRAWFSTACMIHFALPIILMGVGYPIGIYALKVGWIEVPADRLVACLWIWRFACINAFTAMLAAPIWAMYMARQNIAEMTLYGVGQTIIRTAFIYYMVENPGDWLAAYGFAICAINTIPRFLYSVQAFFMFEECRFRLSKALDWGRLRALCAFVSWEALSSLSGILKTQGVSILVNNSLGARVNAAMTVGNQLAAESAALTGAMVNAFTPAIVCAYGAKDDSRMRSMVSCANKYGALLILLFAIPLVFELKEVLRLWLKTPPMFTETLCVFMIVALIVEKISQGQYIAISAAGNIALHRILRSIACLSVLPVSITGVWLGYGICAVGAGLVLASFLSMGADIYIARKYLGMAVRSWLADVVARVLVVGVCVSLVSWGVVSLLLPSIFRVIVTSLVSLIMFLASLWLFAMTKLEKEYVVTVVQRKIRGGKLKV